MRLSTDYFFDALLPALQAVSGIDPTHLLSGGELLSDSPDEPADQYLDPSPLFDTVESKLEQPLVLLRSGWSVPPAETPLNLLLASQPTVRQVLTEFQEFGPTLVEGLTLKANVVGSKVRIQFVSPEGRFQPAVIEWWVAAFASLLQHITEDPGLVQKLLFRHRPRTALALYETCLGIQADFARRIDGLEIARADLSRPLARSSSLVASTMRRLLRQKRKDHGQPGQYQIEAKTHFVLLSNLRSRQGTQVADIARELGMSPRNYQRRLQTTGRSFREVKERAFVDFAKSLLSESDDSIERISRRAGFAHKSAFHRAFKRATGKTPSAYRASRRGVTKRPTTIRETAWSDARVTIDTLPGEETDTPAHGDETVLPQRTEDR